MRWPALFALVTLVSCGAAAELEVGTGSFEFASLPSSGTVRISCGSQGGSNNHHIWTSVRSHGIGPDDVTLKVSIVDPATGATACTAELNGLLLDEAAGWEEFTGVRCFLGDASGWDGKTLRLVGDLSDAQGHSAHDEHVLVPTGFDASCGG